MAMRLIYYVRLSYKVDNYQLKLLGEFKVILASLHDID